MISIIIVLSFFNGVIKIYHFCPIWLDNTSDLDYRAHARDIIF